MELKEVDKIIKNKYKDQIENLKIANSGKNELTEESKILEQNKPENIIQEQNGFFECSIKLQDGSDFIIPVRKDGFVNITKIAKCYNKRVNHWSVLDSTHAFLEAISFDTGIPVSKLIESVKGGNKYLQGSYVDRRVAYNFIMWCDPHCAVQVMKWLNRINFAKNERKAKPLSAITDTSKDEEITEVSKSTIPSITTNNFILTLQGTEYIIPIRPSDGYINLTKLSKAVNYRTNNYFKSENNQAYLKALNSLPQFESVKLYDLVRTGKTQHMFVHRQVVYHYLQYVKPDFAAYVSTILDNLFITGKVELGKEKSSEQLDRIYKEKLTQIQAESQTKSNRIEQIEKQLIISNNNASALKSKLAESSEQITKLQKSIARYAKKHNYIKFDLDDSVYYVFNYGRRCHDSCPSKGLYKHGIAIKEKENECPLDRRLRQHRTTFNWLYLEFVIVANPDAIQQLESSMEVRYRKKLNPGNSEVFEGVTIEQLKSTALSFINMLCPDEFRLISQEKIDEYNKDVDNIIIGDEIEEPDNDQIDEKSKEIEELKTLLIKMHNYTNDRLNEIMKKYGIPHSGNKDRKIEKLSTYIDDKIKGSNEIETV